MNAKERKEFELNRDWLIETAYIAYGITLKINREDDVYVSNAGLAEMVQFYQDWRSEIEEFI